MRSRLFLTVFCCACVLLSGPSYAQSIDYTMMEELFGEPVTTSATGKPQRMSEVPMTMEILTQDDIRRSGAVDLAEALRQINGVSVVQKTSRQYDVTIRGYNQHNSQRLLVLVNGRQVYLDQYGHVEWSTIPVQLEEIKQIEIVKGPNTALFGFNAVNGVVNIVTYNPLYDDVNSAGVTVGTQDYRKGHYVQSMKLSDKAALRFSAAMDKSREFETDINGMTRLGASGSQAEYVDPKREALNVDTMFQVTDKSQLRFEASVSSVDAGGISSLGQANDNEYDTKSAKLTYELDGDDWGLIKANVYKNFLRRGAKSQWGGAVNKVNQSVLIAQLEDVVQLSNSHTVRGQLEYRSNQMTSPDYMEPGSEISYQVYAASSMWNWVMNDQLSWTNALRIDYLDLEHNGVFQSSSPFTEADFDNRDITDFSYNSGFLWKPTGKDTFRLSTGRGLEVPSLIAFGLDLTSAPLTLVGGPNTDSVVVTNYEFAWDHVVEPIDGLFRSALFYSKTKDVKSLFSTVTGLTFGTDNIGDSDSYGVELGVEGKLNKKMDWGLGYIYQVIDDDLDSRTNVIYAASTVVDKIAYPKEFERSNPQHQINLKLGYTDGPLEIDALGYYVSKTDQIYLIEPAGPYTFDYVDSYVGMNARVGYTFDNDVTLALSGQQLLGGQTQTSSTPDVERRVFLSLSKKF